MHAGLAVRDAVLGSGDGAWLVEKERMRHARGHVRLALPTGDETATPTPTFFHTR